MSNEFLDAMEGLLDSGFDPLPPDEYVFKIVEYKLKYVEPLDCSKVEFTLDVTDDNDGYNGRKLWTEGWLDGVTISGKPRPTFETYKMLKALMAEHPEAEYLKNVPHFDAAAFKEDHNSNAIPKDDLTGEPDYSQWRAYFDTIIADELTFRAVVKHVPKRVRVEGEFDANGKQVYVNSDTEKRAVIKKYVHAK